MRSREDQGRLVAGRRALRLARRRGIEPLAPWLIATIATAGLYLGRPLFIPIVLAVLLAFLLAPIVATLRRLRFPRAPAVLLALLMALGGIAVTSAIIVSQASTLAQDAPAYAERVTDKAAAVRAGIRHRFGFLLRESGQGGSGHPNAARARLQGARSERAAGAAVPVEVREAPPTALAEIEAWVVPALAPVETILIVLIVTIFILFQKEDLRDRLIRLMGSADLHRTTVALDEGARRLSRYFLSQFVVNCSFGAVIWGGLFLIGVPSPGLWGIVAGLLRFVPYVGSLVAALGPLALAAAVDPGWGMVVATALLFLLVEPLVGYVVEPLLYGRSTGLSPASVVVAALFWTWIWGPIGLVLAMPITLMLVVLGRHIPAFEIFDVLLGDRPALSPAETFYQRVFAGHPDEAIEQAEDLLETMSVAAYCDEVVLAGLRLAAADVDRGAVERSAMRAVCEATIEVLAALADHRDADPGATDLSPTVAREPVAAEVSTCEQPIGRQVVCMPGRGPLDPAVSGMVTMLLRRAGCAVIEQSRDRDQLAATFAGTICILGLFDPRTYRRIRPVVEQVERRVPGATVLVGVRRGEEDDEGELATGDRLFASCADICAAIRDDASSA